MRGEGWQAGVGKKWQKVAKKWKKVVDKVSDTVLL